MVLGWIGDKDEAVHQVGIWLAANPQSRAAQAADQTWYWRPLLNYPKYRTLVGLPPLDSH